MARSVGQHHGDLRRALIEATVGLLEEGERAPSLRLVARRAGVSPAAPYHHFGSRDGMMAAVAEAGFEALAEVQLAALSTETEPQDRLAAMTAAYVRFGADHPAHYEVLFGAGLDAKETPDSLRDAALATFERLVEAVRACRPELDAADVRARARSAWATAHGAVVLARMQAFGPLGGDPSPEGVSDEVSKAILRDVLG